MANMTKEKEKELIVLGLVILAQKHLAALKECEREICKVAGVEKDGYGAYQLDDIWGEIPSAVQYAHQVVKNKRG